MIHVHSGAGRLGPGLILPFFQCEGVESVLLNRVVPSARPTGGTTPSPGRRNALPAPGPHHAYAIHRPGPEGATRELVRFDGLHQ